MKSEKYENSRADMKKRLETTIQKLKLNQKEFAKKINVTESQLSEIIKGKRFPGFKFFEKIAQHTNININWLLNGKGNMFVQSDYNWIIQEFGDQSDKIIQLMELCKKSPLVKLHLAAWAYNFMLQNNELIDIDIENQKNKSKKED